nr:uncharacterized protein LOC109738102 [Aegilops tauschii subsp. strangulata]
MPEFNAHGFIPNWAELAEGQDTTQAELDYIAARVAEAELAREAGSAGGVEDKAAAEAEEKELAQWAQSAGEASSTGTRAPLVEDVVDESSSEEAEAVHPPGRGDAGSEGEQGQDFDRRPAPGRRFRHTADPPSADLEDIHTVIEDVTKAAEAEAEKTAAEEAAKGAAEDTAKGSAGKPGKGPAGEAGKSAAEEEAQETAKNLAATAEAARTQHQATLKLEGLEGMLSEAQAREGTLAKDLEAEKQLRKNETANHKDFV